MSSRRYFIGFSLFLITVILALPIIVGAAGDPLSERALTVFGTLPASADNPKNPSTDARVALGRALYSDKRLSENHDIACASCHQLDRYRVDGEATSPGHQGQRRGRNSPTSFNAALHVAQF